MYLTLGEDTSLVNAQNSLSVQMQVLVFGRQYEQPRLDAHGRS